MYDTIFITKSFKTTLRKRFWLYAAFLGVFLFLPSTILIPTKGNFSAGFSYKQITPWEYLQTQPSVIWHYIRLFFLPLGLCFDYAWSVARQWQAIVLPGIPLLILVLLTLILIIKKSYIGYLAVFFFITLAPTSSFIPVADLAFEHRMYLPSMSLMLGAVLCVHWFLGKYVRNRAASLKIQKLIFVFAALILGSLTVQRNALYQNEMALWRDTVKKSPKNPRAHNNLGSVLLAQGKAEEAVQHFQQAIQLDSRYAHPYINMGALYSMGERWEEAIEMYRKGLGLNPRVVDANYNWGNAAAKLKRYDEALVRYLQELKLNSQHIHTYNNIANLLVKLNRFPEAIYYYEQGLIIDPAYVKLRHNYGLLLAQLGRLEEAAEQYQTGLEFHPNDPNLHHGYAATLERMGLNEEAVKAYSMAIALRPDFEQAKENLKQLLERNQKALGHV